mgnify:CR=1 FL=1
MENSAKIIQDFAKSITDNLERVIVGKSETVELVVVGLLCQGHLLIDDVGLRIVIGDEIIARCRSTERWSLFC